MNLWTEFQQLIFGALSWIQSLVGDWGMAILLLTVAIRLLLLPLTMKQTKSMLELQRIQPKIKELQEKYKNDKEKLQEETLKFYQENKVNPFGGCLPLLLQSPILFALYGVLAGATGNNKPGLMIQHFADTQTMGTFYSIIPNLASTPQSVWAAHSYLMAIPYILLVIIFGVSVWLPQALMPGDKQQKSIGAVMAVVMLAFGWSAPAGVLLYWDVSSIWGIAQQQIIMVTSNRRAAAEASALEQKKLEEKEAKKTIASLKSSNKKARKR